MSTHEAQFSRPLAAWCVALGCLLAWERVQAGENRKLLICGDRHRGPP